MYNQAFVMAKLVLVMTCLAVLIWATIYIVMHGLSGDLSWLALLAGGSASLVFSLIRATSGGGAR